MEFRFSPEDEALRREAAEFVQREWTVEPRDRFSNGVYSFHVHEDQERVQDFAKRLARKGWWVMHWPREYGGKGVSVTTQLAYREAMIYAGAPTALGGGLTAPPIMFHGQDWQKREFLPRLASAEMMDFSQGFSEPNAGSDLASLQTRAVRDGDDYVLNGQKIWGTYRNPWIHILVRTDPDAPKHRGITSLLAPLKDEKGDFLPGITVRPIYDGVGRWRWDELFLEDARVPIRNRMGEENRGWYVAMTSLNFERSGIEIPTKLLRALETFLDYCKRRRAEGQPLLADARVRHMLADLRVQIGVNQMISYRVAWMQSRGEVPVKEASMSKIWGDELTPRFYRTLARILRDEGVLSPGDKRAPLGGYPGVNGWLSGMNSVGGGTAEIQRNIVAQRGLGLPR